MCAPRCSPRSASPRGWSTSAHARWRRRARPSRATSLRARRRPRGDWTPRGRPANRTRSASRRHRHGGRRLLRRFGHGIARRLYLKQVMRYRETSPARHVPFRGNGWRPGPELVTPVNASDKAPSGAFVVSEAGLHRYMDLSICPVTAGPRCSHRQRQPLVLLAQATGKVWSADMNREKIRDVLRQGQATRSGLSAQRVTDLARGTDRVGETVTLVWCWHRPIAPSTGTILNHDTPGRPDQFAVADVQRDDPAAELVAAVGVASWLPLPRTGRLCVAGWFGQGSAAGRPRSGAALRGHRGACSECAAEEGGSSPSRCPGGGR